LSILPMLMHAEEMREATRAKVRLTGEGSFRRKDIIVP
jgi:hypothetical protein